MKLTRIYIFILGILLVGLLIPTAVLFFRSVSEDIKVLNKDPHFSVSYHRTQLLTDYLSKWDVFGRTYRVDGELVHVEKIIVTFTDVPQKMHIFRLDPDDPPIQTSSTVVTPKGVMQISIQFDPEYHATLSQRDLDLTTNASFIQALYYIVYGNSTNEVTQRDLNAAFDAFTKVEDTPFSVARLK